MLSFENSPSSGVCLRAAASYWPGADLFGLWSCSLTLIQDQAFVPRSNFTAKGVSKPWTSLCFCSFACFFRLQCTTRWGLLTRRCPCVATRQRCKAVNRELAETGSPGDTYRHLSLLRVRAFACDETSERRLRRSGCKVFFFRSFISTPRDGPSMFLPLAVWNSAFQGVRVQVAVVGIPLLAHDTKVNAPPRDAARPQRLLERWCPPGCAGAPASPPSGLQSSRSTKVSSAGTH